MAAVADQDAVGEEVHRKAARGESRNGDVGDQDRRSRQPGRGVQPVQQSGGAGVHLELVGAGDRAGRGDQPEPVGPLELGDGADEVVETPGGLVGHVVHDDHRARRPVAQRHPEHERHADGDDDQPEAPCDQPRDEQRSQDVRPVQPSFSGLLQLPDDLTRLSRRQADDVVHDHVTVRCDGAVRDRPASHAHDVATGAHPRPETRNSGRDRHSGLAESETERSNPEAGAHIETHDEESRRPGCPLPQRIEVLEIVHRWAFFALYRSLAAAWCLNPIID